MRVMGWIGRGGVVVAGAALLLWPALLNGYPLLYPDSMSYLGDGRPLARMLFLHAPKTYAGMRSEIYSLGIFFFHWNVTAWPVIVLQALLVAYVLWLVVRSFSTHDSGARARASRRTELEFLLLTALLSATTSVAWYASFVMPDILGPVLYLAVYLLVFARETLSRREQIVVAAIACWAMAAHSTHLMLSVGLCVLLALLLLFRWPPMGRNNNGNSSRARAVGAFAAIIVIVASAQVGLHAYLYGQPTLFGERMPYLTARIVADGPGRWYLQQHCATLGWAICDRVGDLPDNDDEFLWADGGVWDGATPAQQSRMLAEEMPLVVAAIREYPRAQMQRSVANLWQELTDFGVWDFGPNGWISSQIDTVLPGALPRYLRSRQAQNNLPERFFTRVQVRVVIASALAILCSLPLLWIYSRWRVLGLATILVPAVLANAVITSVLAEPDTRYQARVIWLIPLAAGLIALDLLHLYLDSRSRSRGQRRSQCQSELPGSNPDEAATPREAAPATVSLT